MNGARIASLGVLAAALLTLTTGCQDSGLPASLQLIYSDDTSFEAGLGSGAPSLANSTWDVFPGPILGPVPLAIARVTFGDQGQVVRFEASPTFVGSIPTDLPGVTTSLLADGVTHDLVPGVAYLGGAYGGQSDAKIAVTGFFRYFAGPITVAEVTLAIAGELETDRINGTFGFNVSLQGPAADFLPDADPQASELPIILLRAP